MENSRRQKIAELVGANLFVEQFGWKLRHTANVDWACIDPTIHGKRKEAKHSHPTDACYRYIDPYEGIPSYIIVDFKSYGGESITKSMVETYLKKLAEVVKCAPRSEIFQDKYTGSDTDYNVHGLLFIYNHDEKFEGDFNALLDELGTCSLNIATNQFILVMGPSDVRFFDTMVKDIKSDRSAFADLSNLRFFAPDLETEPVKGLKFGPLTIRMLVSPWIIVSPQGDNPSLFIVYYRDSGSSSDEFLWLIDHLITFQLLSDHNAIQVRGISPNSDASTRFNDARIRYCEEYHGLTELSKIEFGKRLDKITFKSVNMGYSKISEIEVGLE